MTPLRQVAVILLRISAISFFADALIYGVNVPSDIYAIFHYHFAHVPPTDLDQYLGSQQEIALALLLFKTFLFFMMGIVFLVFARPLANLFTRGLE